MRTIKFRGKRLDNGEWVYGDLVHITTKVGVKGTLIIHESQVVGETTYDEADLSYSRNEFSVVFPDTVGQFTGLLDKNGKEIYEGDIVANDFGNAYIVNMAVEWCADGYWALHEIDGDDTMHFVADYLNEIELIGNIHDNPELLTLNK